MTKKQLIIKEKYLKCSTQKKTGSFTVEISLVMPMVLGIIVLVLYICMYIHDVAYIESIAISALDRLNYMTSDEAYELLVYEEITENMRGTLTNWNLEVSVESQQEEVTVIIDAYMLEHHEAYERMIFSRIFGTRIRLRGSVQNEADWIRLR